MDIQRGVPILGGHLMKLEDMLDFRCHFRWTFEVGQVGFYLRLCDVPGKMAFRVPGGKKGIFTMAGYSHLAKLDSICVYAMCRGGMHFRQWA